MDQLAQIIATLSCSMFSGAAVYINLVEHPARLGCGTLIAVTQWAPSYKRATPMQASLAVISLISGILAWLQSGDIGWLVGALLIGAVVPFTLIVIMPANDKLLSQDRDLSSPDTYALLKKWGRLHAVRSVFSALALVIYVVSLARA